MKTVKMLKRGFKVRDNVVSCTIITTFPELDIDKRKNHVSSVYLHEGRLENIIYPAVILNYEKKLVMVTATAKCSGSDKFNLKYGKMLSSMKAEEKLARMHKRLISYIKNDLTDIVIRLDKIEQAARFTDNNLQTSLKNISKPEYIADFIEKSKIKK